MKIKNTDSSEPVKICERAETFGSGRVVSSQVSSVRDGQDLSLMSDRSKFFSLDGFQRTNKMK